MNVQTNTYIYRTYRWLICLYLVMCTVSGLYAQRLPTYSLLQAGGIYGVETSSMDKPMSGYQFQFIYGRNFYEKTFLGLGLGNDVYRGPSQIETSGSSSRRVNTIPIFADFRWLPKEISMLGRIGFMANAGYAPAFSSGMHRGFMGKAGLVYSHMLLDRNDLHFSIGYGFQQFNARSVLRSYEQHNLFLTVGLFTF